MSSDPQKAGIERWLQQVEDDLLYDPDGSEQDAFYELLVQYRFSLLARGLSLAAIEAVPVTLCVYHNSMRLAQIRALAEVRRRAGIAVPAWLAEPQMYMCGLWLCFSTQLPCALCALEVPNVTHLDTD
jgi:hypothetical protein